MCTHAHEHILQLALCGGGCMWWCSMHGVFGVCVCGVSVCGGSLCSMHIHHVVALVASYSLKCSVMCAVCDLHTVW